MWHNYKNALSQTAFSEHMVTKYPSSTKFASSPPLERDSPKKYNILNLHQMFISANLRPN